MTHPASPVRRVAGPILAGTLLLLATACAIGPRPEVPTMDYLEEWRRLQAMGSPFPAGSDAERAALDRFRRLFEDFKAADFETRLRSVYAPEVWFDDTLKTLRGQEAVVRYFVKTSDALESGSAEVLDVASSNGDYYVRWEMRLRFAQLDRGTTHRSVGVSHLRFDRDGRIVLHQDFWDSSRGLFEHVPGLGWLLRQAKRRL